MDVFYRTVSVSSFNILYREEKFEHLNFILCLKLYITDFIDILVKRNINLFISFKKMMTSYNTIIIKKFCTQKIVGVNNSCSKANSGNPVKNLVA